jgi:MFS family permease
LDPRYLVVASAIVIQGVIIGSLFSYGVFLPALEAEFGWSRTLLSTGVSVAAVVMGVCAIVGGQLIDRLGPRWVLTATGVICGCGLALLSTVSQPWHVFIFFGLFVGIGMSTHDVGTLSVIARIFDKRRGMMSGVVKVGTAIGQIIIPLTVTHMILVADWRSVALGLGITAIVLLICAAQGMGLKVKTPTPIAPGSPGATWAGLTLAEAARTRAFWILCIAQLAFMPTLVTIPLHLPAHALDMGADPAWGGELLATIAGASIAGRLMVGRTADWWGGRPALLLSLIALAVSLFVLPSLDAPWMLFGFAICYGFGHGGLFTVVSPVTAEYFGMRAHGAIFGMIIFCGTIGAAIGPLMAGRIFDLTGDYSPAFYGLASLATFAFVLCATLKAPPR